MDAHTRAALADRLSDLCQRRAVLYLEIQREISEPREGKGNPFFYSALPASHPKGKDNYTGISDHRVDAALEVMRLNRDIKDIQRQIRNAD